MWHWVNNTLLFKVYDAWTWRWLHYDLSKRREWLVQRHAVSLSGRHESREISPIIEWLLRWWIPPRPVFRPWKTDLFSGLNATGDPLLFYLKTELGSALEALWYVWITWIWKNSRPGVLFAASIVYNSRDPVACFASIVWHSRDRVACAANIVYNSRDLVACVSSIVYYIIQETE